MKGTRLCAAVVGVLLICAMAEGVDWISFGRSDLGTTYFDRAGIEKLSGGVIRISVKYAYSPEGIKEFRKAFTGVDESQAVSYTLYVYDLDCSAESFRLISAATYSVDDVAIKGTALDLEKARQSAPEHVTPNSMMERLFDAACKWQSSVH